MMFSRIGEFLFGAVGVLCFLWFVGICLYGIGYAVGRGFWEAQADFISDSEEDEEEDEEADAKP